MSDDKSLYDFSLTTLAGAPMPMAQFAGKVVLLVNTASACGFTPQYAELETLWKENKDRGLVVIGVPCNDFGGQEPGTANDIATFCKANYGVTFPMAGKVAVKGPAADPLYVWAGEKAGLLGRPKWNFHKYLFDRNGRFVDWFSSQTKPGGPKISAALASLLG
jgi:glutathione peroxidase